MQGFFIVLLPHEKSHDFRIPFNINLKNKIHYGSKIDS